MSRDVSTTFREAAYAQQTGEVWICLLTITDVGLTAPIRLTSDPFETLPIAAVPGVVSRGNEYIYLPFNIELPTQDDTGISRARLSIENVDRRIVAAVRNGTNDLRILVEIVLASDVDTPELALPDFQLSNVDYDAMTIEGDLTLEYFFLEPFPARRMTPSDFPGLF